MAMDCALQAQSQGEVPVGAVLVLNNHVIAKGWNKTIQNNDPSAHAEIVAMRDAGIVLNNYRLIDTTLYVTLEPCLMCAGAINHARIKRLVYATDDPKRGEACHLNHESLNHHIDIEKGLLQTQASDMLTSFFRQKR